MSRGMISELVRYRELGKKISTRGVGRPGKTFGRRHQPKVAPHTLHGLLTPPLQVNLSGLDSDRFGEVAVPSDISQVPHPESLHERQADRQWYLRVLDERERDQGPADPVPRGRDLQKEVGVQVPHAAKPFDLRGRQ